MKRIYESILALCVASLSVVSCQEQIEPGKNPLTFTGTISLNGGAVTRTTISNGNEGAKSYVGWVSGDEVTISDGTKSASFTAMPNQSDATVATFSPVSTDMYVRLKESSESPVYRAYYGWTGTVSTVEGNTVVSGTLPATQTYDSSSACSNIPMYATGSTYSLNFKSICAVIEVPLKSAQFSKVKSIEISASNSPMCGEFTLNADGVAVLKDTTGTKTPVVLSFGNDGLPLASTATYFYIAVPAGSYSDFNIEITGTDAGGSEHTVPLSATKSDFSLSANNVYSMESYFNAYHQAEFTGGSTDCYSVNVSSYSDINSAINAFNSSTASAVTLYFSSDVTISPVGYPITNRYLFEILKNGTFDSSNEASPVTIEFADNMADGINKNYHNINFAINRNPTFRNLKFNDTSSGETNIMFSCQSLNLTLSFDGVNITVPKAGTAVDLPSKNIYGKNIEALSANVCSIYNSIIKALTCIFVDSGKSIIESDGSTYICKTESPNSTGYVLRYGPNSSSNVTRFAASTIDVSCDEGCDIPYIIYDEGSHNTHYMNDVTINGGKIEILGTKNAVHFSKNMVDSTPVYLNSIELNGSSMYIDNSFTKITALPVVDTTNLSYNISSLVLRGSTLNISGLTASTVTTAATTIKGFIHSIDNIIFEGGNNKINISGGIHRTMPTITNSGGNNEINITAGLFFFDPRSISADGVTISISSVDSLHSPKQVANRGYQIYKVKTQTQTAN